MIDEEIEEFRNLWELEFGGTISKEYAAIRAHEIVMLYQKLCLSEAGLKKEEVEGEEAQPETSS